MKTFTQPLRQEQDHGTITPVFSPAIVCWLNGSNYKGGVPEWSSSIHSFKKDPPSMNLEGFFMQTIKQEKKNVSRNFVAKHSSEYNHSRVFRDRKNDYKRKSKHVTTVYWYIGYLDP